MKKYLLLILLISLVMLKVTAEEKKNSKTTTNPKQTEFSVTFSEEQIRQLVLQMQAEAAAQIDLSYDEGYKAGVLEYAPRAESAEQENFQLRKQLKSTKWNQSIMVPAAIVTGLIVGILVEKVVD